MSAQMEAADNCHLYATKPIRWENSHFGRVSPAEFIPLAESTGDIVAIGDWVLYQACLQYQRWQAQGAAPFKLSVNVSLSQLRMPNFIEWVEWILADTGIAPTQLQLKVTETMIFKNHAKISQKLEQLDELGIQVAIDDFGTGYSSLAVLRYLPVQTLKIDRSFLDDLQLKNKAYLILETIINIGKRVI